ncbi:hypothetical protein EJB05_08720, partial [Eragrostis curvula]
MAGGVCQVAHYYGCSSGAISMGLHPVVEPAGTPEISQRKRTRPRRTSGSYRYHLDFPSPSRRRGDQLPHSSHRAPAPLAPKQAGTTKDSTPPASDLLDLVLRGGARTDLSARYLVS